MNKSQSGMRISVLLDRKRDKTMKKQEKELSSIKRREQILKIWQGLMSILEKMSMPTLT
ncbi:hypothetical protein HMPREF1547_01634 [Blautia sp. KLE 1732]|jgi:hypothetical protein|nr:hypothetical protein HMPREF1547_01634 [Blautia sp. KLE 1732]